LEPHDLLPLRGFRQLAIQSILDEFGGRHPTLTEISSIPDSHLRKLPGFGPTTILKIRSLTKDIIGTRSYTTRYNRDELLKKISDAINQAIQIHDDSIRHQTELANKMRGILNELRLWDFPKNNHESQVSLATLLVDTPDTVIER
jgi:hypothetical protein